ncbi:MAG: hypothetical protein ACJ76J_08525 [Thermoanaerobaculia bacterium]
MELRDFIRWSVPVRASVIGFFAAFVLLDLTRPVLLLFGLVDLACAGWTAWALRTERPSGLIGNPTLNQPRA